jgi:uncharacterized protein (UPF0335 family)
VSAVWEFLQAMDSTSLDYTLDRIERLEREVGRLKDELRQRQGSAAGDAHNSSAAAPKH